MHKIDRQVKIKELINSNKISKQEELLHVLLEKGFSLTQATLSRDLKDLNVGTKYDDTFGQIYFLPNGESNTGVIDTPSSLKGAVSLQISNNLAVLKTLPGFANSVGAIIDDKKIDCILGTVAGNDTILIVFDEKITKSEFINSIGKEFIDIIKILKP